MESNFQKCTFLESSADGTYNRGEGILLKAENRRVTLLGGWVEHRLHNTEVFGRCIIMNSYVPCVYIQADWYHHVIQISGQLDSLRSPESSFSWHDLERTIYCSCWTVAQASCSGWHTCVHGSGEVATNLSKACVISLYSVYIERLQVWSSCCIAGGV